MRQVDRFFVGELHFAAIDSEFTSQYLELKRNGAYQLPNAEMVDSKKYQGFFTLFQKLKNGRYYCLHDGGIYGINTNPHIEHIMPLEDFLPQFNYTYRTPMGNFTAKSLFEKMITQNGFPYDKRKYATGDYYHGDLAICTGLEYSNGRFEDKNVDEFLPLLEQGLLKQVWDTHVPGGIIKNFKMFDVMFLFRNSDAELFCLNNGRFYNYLNEFANVHEEGISGKNLASHISFGKILKLQKRGLI